MSNPYFDHPILNSPYECPSQHWESNADGQPKQKTIATRLASRFILTRTTPEKYPGLTPPLSHPSVHH